MFCKNKVFYACNFINKKTLAQISFAKFLRTSFLQTSSDKQYTKAQQKDPLRFQMSCNQNSICTWIFLIRSQKYDIWLGISHTITKIFDIWLDISHTITKIWYLIGYFSYDHKNMIFDIYFISFSKATVDRSELEKRETKEKKKEFQGKNY